MRAAPFDSSQRKDLIDQKQGDPDYSGNTEVMESEAQEWREDLHRAFREEERSISIPGTIIGALISSIPLMLGVIFDHRTVGLFASLGGLNVGLALSSGSQKMRLRWGMVALVGSTIGVALATSIHNIGWLALLLSFFWIAGWALLRAIGVAGIFVGFVNAAVFIIVLGQPENASNILPQTISYFVGGLIGLVLIALFVTHPAKNREELQRIEWNKLWTALCGWNVITRHALRAGFLVAAGTALYRGFALDQGYWIPLAIVAVIQPDGTATRVRALQRGAGTLVGVSIAGIIAIFTHNEAVLVACVFLSSGSLFALKDRGYYWLVILLTPTVIFMLSAIHLQGGTLFYYRIIDNAIGIIMALLLIEVSDRLLKERRATT